MLQFYSNQDNDGNVVDPISDTGPDGGRAGDPIFDSAVFQGDTGDVKFTRVYLHNESDDYMYSDIRVDAYDLNESGGLPLEISESFTVERPGGSDITIPAGMVGQPRLQFFYEEGHTTIPEDPQAYSGLIEPGDMLPSGAPSDTRVIYLMMVIEPNKPTSVYEDIQPRVRAVESVPTS